MVDKVKKKINHFFSNNIETTIFSLSILVIGILFLFVLADLSDGVLIEQRKLTGTIFIAIAFFILPFDFDKKDKFVFELCKFLLSLIALFFISIYFIAFSYQNIVFDLVFSFICVPTLFYLIRRTYHIFKKLTRLIQTLSNKLFNNNTNNTYFNFFKILTAYLVSISTALGSIYAIVKTFKSLFT